MTLKCSESFDNWARTAATVGGIGKYDKRFGEHHQVDSVDKCLLYFVEGTLLSLSPNVTNTFGCQCCQRGSDLWESGYIHPEEVCSGTEGHNSLLISGCLRVT